MGDPDRLEKATPLVRGLVEMLNVLESWIVEFPPLAQPMRFGNKAFRSWHNRLSERAESMLLDLLKNAHASGDCEALAFELSFYLRGSFGDETRIDYGTGHEAAFFAILFALGS